MPSVINGVSHEISQTPLQQAQQRLADVCLKQPMDGKIMVVSFINVMLQSAKIAALTELMLEPTNATWTTQERYDSLLTKHLGEVASTLESVSQQPRIALASGGLGAH